MAEDNASTESDARKVVQVVSLGKAWFWLRAYKITASMASVCMGLSKRASPQALYWKLTTCPMEQTPDNPQMASGRLKEPLVIKETEKRLGIKIEESAYIAHLLFPWLAATPDGRVVHDDYRHPNAPTCRAKECQTNIECKAPYFRPYDYPPLEYVIQTYVQMFTTNIKVSYLTTYWADGQCMRIWMIEWSDAAWLWMMQRMMLFMTFLRLRISPPASLLPSVADANQELLNGNFDPKLRQSVARKHRVKDHDLLPTIPIKCLIFDEDPYYYVNGTMTLKA